MRVQHTRCSSKAYFKFPLFNNSWSSLLFVVCRCCQFQFQTHLIIDLLNGVYPSNCWSDASCSSCTFFCLIFLFSLHSLSVSRKSTHFTHHQDFFTKTASSRASYDYECWRSRASLNLFSVLFFFVDFWNIYISISEREVISSSILFFFLNLLARA